MYIREALSTDLSEIVNIYNSTISDRMATADLTKISVKSRLDWLKNRDFRFRPVWVIEKQQGDSQILGWLSFNDFYGRPAYQQTAELSIYIAWEHRHQGIGSYLLEQAIATCPKLRIKVLLGFIFAHNKPSLKLFQKYDFVQWGKLPQVAKLDQQDHDLIILGKTI